MQARSVNLREHILDVASGLFYKHGLRNVGIDRIIGESGIARMTLYNHFKSKDLLIEEYLRRASSRWMKWYAGKIERIERRSARARARRVQRARRLVPLARLPRLLGDQRHGRARRRSASRRRRSRTSTTRVCAISSAGLASDAGAEDRDELVEQLIVVLRGAMTTALVEVRRVSRQRARRTAEHLLDAHLQRVVTTGTQPLRALDRSCSIHVHAASRSLRDRADASPRWPSGSPPLATIFTVAHYRRLRRRARLRAALTSAQTCAGGPHTIAFDVPVV